MTGSAGFNTFFRLRYIILFLALIAWAAFVPPPAEKRLGLLIAEYDAQAAQNHQQHLWRFNFNDAAAPAKEKLLTVQGQKTSASGSDKTSYIRMDIGTNTVYRNRWVITGIGNVIDLQEKKVALDTKDRFIKASGDSLVFFTNDIFKGKYYSVAFKMAK